jgi:hypothetical protein
MWRREKPCRWGPLVDTICWQDIVLQPLFWLSCPWPHSICTSSVVSSRMAHSKNMNLLLPSLSATHFSCLCNLSVIKEWDFSRFRQPSFATGTLSCLIHSLYNHTKAKKWVLKAVVILVMSFCFLFSEEKHSSKHSLSIHWLIAFLTLLPRSLNHYEMGYTLNP